MTASTPETTPASTSASRLVTPLSARASRRGLLQGTAAVAVGAALGGGLVRPRRTYARPSWQSGTEIIVSTQQFSQEPFAPFIEEFTGQTGITVSFYSNPSAGGDQVAQLTPQFAASSTPVDVLSCSDEVAPLFIRAGWMEPLNEIATEEFWSDWDPSVVEYTNVWSTIDNEVFRIPHGWSVGFYWTRQDYLKEYGVEAPANWDDIRALGDLAKADDRYAFADAASIPSLAFVYAAYLCAQSGGDIFAFDDNTRAAFEFAREMVDNEWFPRSAASWTYDQLNAAYLGDQVVTMRQWNYFYDVARDGDWFSEDKVTVTLPPAGPAGGPATWAGAWGWTVPKFTQKRDAAMEFITYMTSNETAPKLAQAMSDYITPRASVFDVMGDEGVAGYIKTYSEAGAIKPRPFHPRVSEAQAIVDTQFNGYLAGQISIDDAIANGQRDIEALNEEL